jgi:phage tail-like protein
MPDSTLYTAFNFLVEIAVPGIGEPLCDAAFAECDGLEQTMEPKTFLEGGNNARQIHLAGPVSYSQLTLRRGMSADAGLWRWFGAVQRTAGRGLRGQGTIVLLAADGQTEQLRFKLYDCLPVKLKAPALNAREGLIAIEELQLVYAGFDVAFPEGGGVGIGIGASARLGVGV